MNKRLNLALRILCLIIALASVAGLVWQWSMHQHGLKVNEAMRALFDPSAGAEELAPREQFQALLDANPDTIGWLKATETIDFAVVQRITPIISIITSSAKRRWKARRSSTRAIRCSISIC